MSLLKLRIQLRNRTDETPCYYKDIELPFLPPVGMWMHLGEMPNTDLVAGEVTELEHDFVTDITSFTCTVIDSNEDIDIFTKHNSGWTSTH